MKHPLDTMHTHTQPRQETHQNHPYHQIRRTYFDASLFGHTLLGGLVGTLGGGAAGIATEIAACLTVLTLVGCLPCAVVRFFQHLGVDLIINPNARRQKAIYHV